MTSTYKTESGFTLIELLVVMAIVGTLVSLVGGLALDSYQKFQQKAELVTVENLLKNAANQAFLLEKNVHVSADIGNLTFIRDDRVVYHESFSFLQFSPLEFDLNAVGLYSVNTIDVRVGGRLRALTLND